MVEWDRIYGGDGDDYLRSISLTPDGGLGILLRFIEIVAINFIALQIMLC